MDVIAARSSWRSISLSYSTVISLPQICSRAYPREKALRENFSIGAFIGYLFAECAETHHMIVVTSMKQEEFGTARIHAVQTLDEALALSRGYSSGTAISSTAALSISIPIISNITFTSSKKPIGPTSIPRIRDVSFCGICA